MGSTLSRKVFPLAWDGNENETDTKNSSLQPVVVMGLRLVWEVFSLAWNPNENDTDTKNSGLQPEMGMGMRIVWGNPLLSLKWEWECD